MLHDVCCVLHAELAAPGTHLRGIDHGVDADEAAARVQEGPAAVAGVDGRVGLDDVADLALRDALDLPVHATHHPRCMRAHTVTVV